MTDQTRPIDKLLWALQERAKELNCLYRIEELLTDPEADLAEVFEGVVRAIPPGWQYPDICHARVIYGDTCYALPSFAETPWMQTADIELQDQVVGKVEVYYTREMPTADVGPFLKEEAKLIATIADRIGHFVQYLMLRQVQKDWQSAKETLSDSRKDEWRVVVDLLKRTDQNLYRRISRKMFVRLCSSGVREVEALQERMSSDRSTNGGTPQDENRPTGKAVDMSAALSEQVFTIAPVYFSGPEILSWIQKWIQEDKSSFLIAALESFGTSLSEISDAIRRFTALSAEGVELSATTEKEVRVSLIRRFFTDQLDYINVAKEFVDVHDFYDLLQRLIFPTGSHGKLGGKSAGLFLASRIIKRVSHDAEVLKDIKTPKTWYITSDALLSFVTYNNLEELVEHKYKEIDEIRREYGQIMQVFKHSSFTQEIVQGLSMALDDFGDRPLIVRSSSLLEDRLGSAFSGKYKSLFLANQGTKRERLDALLDAIAEVYSSTFGPDPIQYRAERGLLDYREEMGIMIQEVVGTQIGKYFLPAFAGVAFSNNEFRWSPRIRRKDGLLRLVPGLGTRAVDRLSDDYPVLIAPGQPGLRVNISPEEVVRYSPNKMDVINLETNSFETVDIRKFIRDYGNEIPWLNQLVSIYREHSLQAPTGMYISPKRDECVVTFEGLITRTPFIKQMQTILHALEAKLGTPVDIEFAHDGKDFYLLQCRPQSYSQDALPAVIPPDIPPQNLIFSANRYVSNGKTPDITHIVYVDPQRYSEIRDLNTLTAIGRAVSFLNKTLPKRQFILMGPGRWGSRGDVKLGVSVTYSDISNTAMLVEIARKQGNYIPDLSFGTHFFQDLVEASIRYLPLYPDDTEVVFNEEFLLQTPNMLADLAPEYAALANVVHVIDIPKAATGRIMRILMNAEIEQAVAILTRPVATQEIHVGGYLLPASEQPAEEHWRWRLQMAERIAEHLDPDLFGVKAMYVFGSAKNATAGPGSDIDLLVHFAGEECQREKLEKWLEGWSLCLDETNYLRTGYRSGTLLDVHIVTDEDIAARNPFAAKIGAVTDAARPLTMKRNPKSKIENPK
jgi:pyruvate,water dikinase